MKGSQIGKLRSAQHQQRRYTLAAICCLLCFSACSNARYLQSNELLYNGTEVVFADSMQLPEDLSNLADQLEDLSKMKPNKKVLGIYPLKMWLYNLGNTGFDQFLLYADGQKGSFSLAPLLAAAPPLQPDSDFRSRLVNKLGEKPSIIEENLIEDTRVRMENYLYNRGYFNPESTYELVPHQRKKSAVVKYQIKPNQLVYINQVNYEIADQDILRLVTKNQNMSPLQAGKRFDVDFLKGERKRISEELLNNGYLLFNREYVYFEVDTGADSDKLDIYVKISLPEQDSVHRRFKIRNIYLQPDVTSGIEDTIQFDELTRKGTFKSSYYILQPYERFTPKSLANNVFIASGDYYSQAKISQTIGAFSNLNMFKYATVSNIPVDSGIGFSYVDLLFKLEPLQRQDLTAEFNTSTTSEYLLANYGNISYSRLNVFKRLDALRFALDGGIESQISNRLVAINTTEFTTQINLVFPRFFWPFSLYTPKSYYPRTISTLKFEYLERLQFYTLYNTAFKYGSERFEGSRKQQLNLYPIDINYVRVPRTTTLFDSILNDNFLLQQAFQQQFIMAPNLAYIYNSQAIGNARNDIYFRAGLELAGTLVHLTSAAFNDSLKLFGPDSRQQTPLTLFGEPFSTYTRVDLDFRHYFDFGSDNTLVTRTAIGMAVPYWNSQVAPFVKQFFVGGANSIRAFPIRKVGPGSYLSYEVLEDGIASPKPEDQTGDLKLEMNVELRFDIVGIVEGALFCDIGNVWTLKEDVNRPGAEFEFKDFYRELAVGPGAGLRVDFSYFVIRLDAAYPLVDPAIDGPRGKFYRDELGITFPDKQVNWNFAIGYPF